MTKKKAFTFVEVMITIAILGIIAALIIPILLAGINERRWITGCKKAYTTLSQATDAAILDRGPLKDWPGADADSEKVYRYFAQHLNITKECLQESGCWTRNIKGLNGSTNVSNFTDQGYGTPAISFKTADGMNMAFDLQPADTVAGGTWQGVSRDYNITNRTDKNQAMYTFHVDVNGDQGPNVIGKDIYNFVVTQKGLVPAGDKNSNDNGCNKNTDGMKCAARVLGEGKMSYLHE